MAADVRLEGLRLHQFTLEDMYRQMLMSTTMLSLSLQNSCTSNENTFPYTEEHTPTAKL